LNYATVQVRERERETEKKEVEVEVVREEWKIASKRQINKIFMLIYLIHNSLSLCEFILALFN